jgi:hypothetical protein
MKPKLTTIPALAVCLAISSHVRGAVIWLETGAGRLPSTAEIVDTTEEVTSIFGNLMELTEVDMYGIFVSDPGSFSATTLGGVLNIPDPQLFLFDSSGRGVYMNDNGDGIGAQSHLEAGDPFGPTSPGLYYLAIGWFNNEPLSSLGNIFNEGSGTNGPDPIGGAEPIESWNDDVVGRVDSPTAYEIRLTGVGPFSRTPEPSSLALLGAGLCSLFVCVRRRRRF